MPNRVRASLRPSPTPWTMLAVVGAGALALGACSSSSTSPTSSTPTARPAASGRPVATGQISSVGSSSMVVADARTGSQVTVDWSSSTTFDQTVTATVSDLTVGDCVSVFGAAASSSAPATARTVSITKPTSSGCARPGGFGGRTGGGGGGFGGFGGGDLPFTSATGTVTSLGSGTLTVQGTSSSGSATTTFGYDATTTFTRVQAAHASSATAGQCATAYGTSSSSGAVEATSVLLRPAGPDGCSGFGGAGGGFGGGGGGGFGGGGASAET